VLSLLRFNPFPDQAPKFVRAELFQYQFASEETRLQTGQWWVRSLVGPWFPQVSLDSPPFQRFLKQQGWL